MYNINIYIYMFYFSFYYSWSDVLQDFINLINVDVDVDVETTLVWSNHLIQLHLKILSSPVENMVWNLLTKYKYYLNYKLSIIFRAKTIYAYHNRDCSSQKLKPWGLCAGKELKRVFCSFVFIIRDFNSKGFNPERDAYVVCFLRVLSSGTKNNSNKRHLLYFSRMAQQRAFRQRNRCRACTWPL